MKARYITAFVSLLIFNGAIAQKKNGFILDCGISGLKDGTKAYLCINPGVDTVARAESKNGHFIFNGAVANDVNFYFIKLSKEANTEPSQGILLMNTSMTLKSSTATWPAVEMTGSEANDDFVALVKLYKDAQAKVAAGKTNEDSVTMMYKDYINTHRNSLYVADLILKFAPVLKVAGTREAYENLTDRAKNSYFALELKRFLGLRTLSTQIKEGGELPDFKMTLPNGGTGSVLEYAKKGKITLIDFWASWCGPCKAEVPNMKKVYDAFHSKGFNIISISTDQEAAAWKNAIAEDKTPWFHGRDDLDKASGVIFTIAAIPAFALVDGEGKFIAFSCGASKSPSFGPVIRGQELYTTIKNLLEK
nr:TlpA disulfide reductase family protein [Pedobacter sp. ASV19]